MTRCSFSLPLKAGVQNQGLFSIRACHDAFCRGLAFLRQAGWLWDCQAVHFQEWGCWLETPCYMLFSASLSLSPTGMNTENQSFFDLFTAAFSDPLREVECSWQCECWVLQLLGMSTASQSDQWGFQKTGVAPTPIKQGKHYNKKIFVRF